MRKLMLAVVLLCLFEFPNTFAQTSNATLGGTVSDPSGALIPGVTVTATNTATGIVSTFSAMNPVLINLLVCRTERTK